MSGDITYRSLFVSDLLPDVTETMLLNAFSSSGPIVSVRIVRHKESRQSLGYGYVNFVREMDARSALITKNFMEINGKQIRVTAAQSDPNLRKTNNSNVFVKNLDKSVDNKRLYELFKPFGPILSFKLAQEVSGQSKGYGFVKFETEQSAIDAIIALNGRQLEGRILFCSKFLPKNERQKYMRNTIEVKSYANIYVKNLSSEFNDNILKEMFIIFGPVIAVKVFHKNSKHFGFISFKDSMTAEMAIKALNGISLPNGCTPFISRAFKLLKKSSSEPLAQKRSEGRDIYIKYLDHSIDRLKLRQIFSSFGEITAAMVYPLYYFQWSFGFVSFSSPESAQKAVQHMNNTILGNRSIFVSIAQSLCERNKCLANKPLLKPKGMSHIWNQSVGYTALTTLN